MMKIAINALSVDGGGGQTYIENLLPELDQRNDGNTYVVLLRKHSSVVLPPLSSRFQIVQIRIPSPFLIWRFLLEQFYLPFWLKKEKIDLLYSPADAATLLAPCPVVLAMRNPNLYVKQNLGWPLRYKLKFSVLSAIARLSTRKAREIIFVSHASKKFICEGIGIPDPKINVVYHGVSRIFFRSEESSERMACLTHDKVPYLLSVSSVYRYKNYVRLVEAFHEARKILKQDCHLIIIGSAFDTPYLRALVSRIQELNLKKEVHHLGGMPLSQLSSYYRHAALFVFPSFLETFGHTLVEAMAAELPIAAADIEPTREITGGAALFFDPFNIQSIAHAICEGITNQKLRQSLIIQGRKRVQDFSWKLCADQTAKIFLKAARRKSREFDGF